MSVQSRRSVLARKRDVGGVVVALVSKKIAFNIEPYIAELSTWNPEVETQASRTDRDSCIVHADHRGDRNRGWNEGVGVSCGLEIVDEVGLEVSADLEDGLGSWQSEKTPCS